MEDNLRRLHSWGPPLQAALAVAAFFPGIRPRTLSHDGAAAPGADWLPVVLYLWVLQVITNKT